MFGLCRDMTEDDAVVISSNGQLTLTSVSSEHEGEWRCQVTNNLGRGEARTRLTVTPVKGNNTHTHTHTHTQTHTHTHTHTHLTTPHYATPHHTMSCPILSCILYFHYMAGVIWPFKKGRYRNSKNRATTLLGHTWFYRQWS